MKFESGKWAPGDVERRDQVLELIREYMLEGRTIPHQPSLGVFGGFAGDFHYSFEGEEDLLHLTVARKDGSALDADDTRDAARFLLPGVPPAMVWLRPGVSAHHYYLGHDLLATSERSSP